MKTQTGGLLVTFLAASLAAQTAPPAQKDSATFDPDGTAHITRVVPMPTTISPEAQTWLESLTRNSPGPETLAVSRECGGTEHRGSAHRYDHAAFDARVKS